MALTLEQLKNMYFDSRTVQRKRDERFSLIKQIDQSLISRAKRGYDTAYIPMAICEFSDTVDYVVAYYRKLGLNVSLSDQNRTYVFSGWGDKNG